ncbi:polysaccharide pyruvyl transferase family protein [Desulfuromonas sp. AOP6]|uniref:polysaccharide pyruvyl transferase family protein n=1 Tax=Desulfuromonas sp. AOP6 TaxID=1566351 RepID=UPI001283C433|nr:polysaccharide pyruvyl transferase family protein [Desulfuromonas sp. AOP6]BCA80111.1 hypothetical protein AOP6_1898 [Desulfuromonas sp. AOP6]
MYLEYSHTVGGNFGDDLNPWLWPRLIPELLAVNDSTAFLGIGTLLDQQRVKRTLGKSNSIVVFSSGMGFGSPPKIDERWKIYCVRGPLTAKRLGLPSEMAIVDGAFLLRTVAMPDPSGCFPVGFMPHHRSEVFIDWHSVCERAGVKYISAKQSVDKILADLRGTKHLITEAMHGAIVADALRVPWMPVRFSPKFMPEKWQDFTASINLNIETKVLPFLNQYRMPVGQFIENSAKGFVRKLHIGPEKWDRLPRNFRCCSDSDIDSLAKTITLYSRDAVFYLSKDEVTSSLTERLCEKLEELKKDFKVYHG